MNKHASVLKVEENVGLAPYTTLGVGGPARFLVKATAEEQVLSALEFARARGCPLLVLGGGSNLVISDSGFPGLAVKIELPGIRSMGDESAGRISAAAGVEWDAFVQYCVKRNLAGIECLSGIPGTVGGAPVQNIGAYGEEAGEVIVKVIALDRISSRVVELSNEDCRFAYRSSVFNTTHRDRHIILSVDFALRAGGLPCIRYPDIRKQFGEGADPPKIGEVREAVLQARRSKAMVLQDGDPDCRSAGSFFKNPVLDTGAIAAMEIAARAKGILDPAQRIPRFPAASGKEKVPAAWLIEHAGFSKGYVYKNAGISSKHALALINRGKATAGEILELMRLIRSRVEEVFGVMLHPEPVFVGFDERP